MPGTNAASEFVASALTTFAYNKHMVDRSITQLSDSQLHEALASETNSIAVLMKHMSGNLISRFTDFLYADGEKPWRDRDDEFVDTFASRDEMLDYWNRGWAVMVDAIEHLTDADLERIVTVRGEPLTVMQAITRSLAHFSYHAGQIVMISRILAGDGWRMLTIPRGGSREFNESTWGSGQYRNLAED